MIEPCTIRTVFTFVSLAYFSLTNITLPIPETNPFPLCASLDCAIASIADTGMHVPPLHIGVTATRVCDEPDIAGCLLRLEEPFIASSVCGVITEVALHEEELIMLATDADESQHMITANATDPTSDLGGEFWILEVFDLPPTGSEDDNSAFFDSSLLSKLMIAAVSIGGAIFSALAAKWGIKYAVSCKRARADGSQTELYLT